MKQILPILTLLILFGSFSSHAQQEYRKGYIVSFEGDTTRGLLQLQNPKKPFLEIKFKESFKSDAVIYTPYEVMGFGFEEGRYYESTIIKSIGWRPSFYEVIFDGDLKLIQYDGSLYLVDGPDYKILQKTKKMVNFGTSRQVYEYDEYKDVLFESLEEWPEKIIKVDRSALNATNLAQLLEEYHQVKDYDYNWYKESYPWSRFSLRILGGGNLSAAAPKSQAAFYKAADSKTRQNLMPNIGIGFVGNLPEVGYRTSFSLDLMYARTDHEFYYAIQNAGERIVVEYEYVTEIIRVPFHVRYALPGRLNNYPYLMAGGTFNFNSQGEGTRTMNYYYATTSLHDDPIPYEINDFTWRPSFGLGYNLNITKRKNIFFEWRYELGRHTVNYPYLSKDITVKEYLNYFLVGFSF